MFNNGSRRVALCCARIRQGHPWWDGGPVLDDRQPWLGNRAMMARFVARFPWVERRTERISTCPVLPRSRHWLKGPVRGPVKGPVMASTQGGHAQTALQTCIDKPTKKIRAESHAVAAVNKHAVDLDLRYRQQVLLVDSVLLAGTQE